MARNKSHKSSKALHTSLIAQRKHQNQIFTLLAATAVRVVTKLVATSICTTPINTSKLTGMDWVRELLMGHPIQFSDALAVPKHVYWKLVKELQLYAGLTHLKYVLLEEQVAMFLHFCETGGTLWDLQERFQHSPSTISKYGLHLVLMFCSFHNDSYSSIIYRILDMVVSPTFHNRYVKLLPAEQTPPEIQNDPKLYPFFKDCRGAIDGTHIVAFVPDDACYGSVKLL